MADEIKKPELKCNCNDEFRTEVCPVHCKEKPVMANVRNNMATVVMDKDLVPSEIDQWMGYTFKCPKCGNPAIMDFMKYCGNCGSYVLIRSQKVTDFVKQLQETYNNGTEKRP